MNRRGFLKGILGAGVALAVPDLILPEKRIWALGGLPLRTHVLPSRRPGDDTAFVQWHIDNGIMLPPAIYDIHAPILIRNKTDAIVDGSGTVMVLHGKHQSYMKAENLEGCIITGFNLQRANQDTMIDYTFVGLEDHSSYPDLSLIPGPAGIRKLDSAGG